MQSKEEFKDPQVYNSDYYEAEIVREIECKSFSSHTRCNLDSESLVVPKCDGNLPERHLYFEDIKDKNKKLWYRVFIAAYNYLYTNEFAAISIKRLFNQASYLFINWLNDSAITNRYKLLKDYESYIF